MAHEWDIADLEGKPWAHDQWEYRRLTHVWAKVHVPEGDAPLQRQFFFLEDEIKGMLVQVDPNLSGALNRLGRAGWRIKPISSQTGDVPLYLMQKAWDLLRDDPTAKPIVQEGGWWTVYFMSRQFWPDSEFDVDDSDVPDDTDGMD